MFFTLLFPLLALSAAKVEYCVLPPTRHLNFSDSCSGDSDNAAISSRSISWAGMRGEFESAQVLVSSSSEGRLGVTFSDLVGPKGESISNKQLSWRQQGYVFVRHTQRYSDSGCPNGANCWRPDPLLEPENGTIALPKEPGRSQPLWITVSIPRDASPAPETMEYRGQLILSVDGEEVGAIMITLEVWNFAVPTTVDAQVQHDWHFNSRNLPHFYPNQSMDQIRSVWWQFMEEHRLPPIDDAGWAAKGVPYLDGKTRVLETQIRRDDCNCSVCPEAAARKNAAAMKKVIKAADRLKGAKLNVYGFDEADISCEQSVRTAFAAVLEEYEQVGTMSALNWAKDDQGSTRNAGLLPEQLLGVFQAGSSDWLQGEEEDAPAQGEPDTDLDAAPAGPAGRGLSHMPLDMPLTSWVLGYHYYTKETADVWVNSTYKGRKRELYLYHCIEPSGPQYLNLFIERPLIHARLLFWLGSVENIQGWLYWATNLWMSCADSPYEWQRKPKSVMRRINDTMFTDFDPASIIWCNQRLYDLWVNGDGYYMYPGENGPISTSRLEEIRNALEDMELMRMASEEVRRSAVSQLVTSATAWQDDPVQLEEVRRRVGRHLSRAREAAFVI